MRARKGLGATLAIVGVLCLAVAALLAWAVVPNREQLPADTATTRQYEGTADVLLNAQALNAGDLRAALIVDTPVTAQRTVTVEATDGSAAEVSDERQLTANGQTVGQSQVTYAVDRTSLESTTAIPSDWRVTPHQGLTVSWPIHTQKRDYTGWVNETRTTVPLRYERAESRGGVDTYVYTASVPATPIKDEQVLAGLPRTLPVSVLGTLASVLPIPPEVQAGLAQALPGLANPVPLAYTYESTSTYWIEPSTGIVVDTDRHEVRQAGIGGPGGSTIGSVAVFDVSTRFTPASVTAAADDARGARSTVRTFGTVVPWVLTGVGAIALVAGLVLARPGHRT